MKINRLFTLVDVDDTSDFNNQMEEKINELFTLMDVDCNGMLSKKEFMKAITLDPEIRSKIKGIVGGGNPTTFLHPKTFGEDINATFGKDISKVEWLKWINYQKWCHAVDQDCATGATDDEEETDDDEIKLLQEQWRLRKLINDAEKAREAPNMVMYFKTMEHQLIEHTFNAWRAFAVVVSNGVVVSNAVPTIVPAVSPVAPTRSTTKATLPTHPTLSTLSTLPTKEEDYWINYQQNLPKDQALMKRAYSVLTDNFDVVSHSEERRRAMVLSKQLLPSFTNRYLLPTATLSTHTGTIFDGTIKTTMGISTSMPNLHTTTGTTGSETMTFLGGTTKVTHQKTYRKRVWIPSEVTLDSIRR